MNYTFNPISKKNQKRYDSFFNADGSPKKVRIYDNGGDTADRYTCVFTGSYRSKTNGQFWVLGCCESPSHPMGIGYTEEYDHQIDKPKYSHLGKKVNFADVAEGAQSYIVTQYKYLWNFTDENNKVL